MCLRDDDDGDDDECIYDTEEIVCYAMLYLSHGEDCIDEQQDDDNRDEQCEVVHRASQH